jgi:hypothetical protein
VYVLKVVTADAMQQVKESQAVLETKTNKEGIIRVFFFLERKMLGPFLL